MTEIIDARSRPLRQKFARGGPRPPGLSLVLRTLAERAEPQVSLREIMTALSDRSFGALFILIAAPNLIPLPPGSSFIFSIPIIIIAAQLVWGRTFPWLPSSILDRKFDRSILKSLAERLGPPLARIESMLKPRLTVIDQGLQDRLIGLLALIAGVILFLPIPLANFVPALAIVLLGLGMIERDGIVMLVGVLLILASIAIVAAVGGATASAATAIWEYLRL
ncbi:MAG TPA: exopolysaccharide biosynthesis protein [Aestuariivirgaceae bacterium]|jgi:hypothetical protein|nr:exopolysaccharide biosynthesis protein [Aestuariivirgaceae bacterium]